MTPFEVSLNGERVPTEAATLQALLQSRGYPPGGAFACAINSVFVPRAQWPERALAPDDRIDVITPIQGG